MVKVYSIDGVTPVVHPSAYVHPSAVLRGCRIGRNALVGMNELTERSLRTMQETVALTAVEPDRQRVNAAPGGILHRTKNAKR